MSVIYAKLVIFRIRNTSGFEKRFKGFRTATPSLQSPVFALEPRPNVSPGAKRGWFCT